MNPNVLKITSRDNAIFKKYLSLTTAKGIKKESLFLLSGKTLLKEFIALAHSQSKWKPDDIICEVFTSQMKTLSTARKLELSKELFDELDVLGTKHPLFVVRLPQIIRIDLNKSAPQGLEVLLPLGDPNNLGAAIRSCEAFGVSKVILLKECAHPFLPRSIKSSSGSVLRQNIYFGPDIAEIPHAKSNVALDSTGTDITEFRWQENQRLLIGEEGQGIHKSNITKKIRIPTEGVESLNATVAISIALFHCHTQLKQGI